MNEKKKNTKIIALGIVEDSSGNVLISLRNDPSFPDAHLKWDLVGGTNEFGEPLEETLRREVKEETGYEIEIIKLLPRTMSKTWINTDTIQHTLLFCFNCKVKTGTLQLGDKKIKELKWISRTEIESYEFLPNAKEFLLL